MPDLFTDCENAQDLAYKNICSAEYAIEQQMKVFCESLWYKFEIHADTHFLTQIRRSFYERYWEMYLTSSLIDWGFEVRSSRHGPDILIENNDLRIWIEAVASGNGDPISNPDAVPDIETGAAQLVPEEKIILRLRSSIEAKSLVYHNYIRDSIIESNEPFIIALNGAKLNFMSRTDDIPYILKSILPIGDHYYDFQNETAGITYRDAILRENGTEISTNVFLDDNYKHISAILYSNTHAGRFDEDIGSDYILIHNHNAINPLPFDIIQNGKVIRIETNNDSNTFLYQTENV
jgi:hypothetical protein